MNWLIVVLVALLAIAGIAVAGFLLFLLWMLRTYLGVVSRIFEERPLFIVPRGQPVPGSEEVRFPTSGGLMLCGSYLRTSAPERRGVILFGPEFGSNRWSCVPYCEHLLAGGFDLLTFDFRNQGESDRRPDYDPLQWVTDHEVRDMQAAIAYLKRRPDTEAQGIGFFGVSRGGGAGILAAASDPWVRCVATDGAFATRTTMVSYMKKWVVIYSNRLRLQRWLSHWVYVVIAEMMLWRISKRRKCRFPRMEWAVARLAPRPLLMIHGGADSYIKPDSARALFERAREPKEFWLVEGAKHNQALNLVGDQYHQRLLEFFSKHLGGAQTPEPLLASGQIAS